MSMVELDERPEEVELLGQGRPLACVTVERTVYDGPGT
jgi:hypothetical protein